MKRVLALVFCLAAVVGPAACRVEWNPWSQPGGGLDGRRRLLEGEPDAPPRHSPTAAVPGASGRGLPSLWTTQSLTPAQASSLAGDWVAEGLDWVSAAKVRAMLQDAFPEAQPYQGPEVMAAVEANATSPDTSIHLFLPIVQPYTGAFMGKFVQVVEDSVIVDYDTDLAGRAFVVDGTVFLKGGVGRKRSWQEMLNDWVGGVSNFEGQLLPDGRLVVVTDALDAIEPDSTVTGMIFTKANKTA